MAGRPPGCGKAAADLQWGPNWEDDLAGAPERARLDPNLRDGVEEHVRLECERAFMFYLPRICEHCLNPSCVASCPSGAMYKRVEDGIVLVRSPIVYRAKRGATRTALR